MKPAGLGSFFTTTCSSTCNDCGTLEPKVAAVVVKRLERGWVREGVSSPHFCW